MGSQLGLHAARAAAERHAVARSGGHQHRASALLRLPVAARRCARNTSIALQGEPLAAEPIVSLGVVLFTYLRLKLHLRIAGFAPVFHDYDWRLGIDELGRGLAERLRAEPGRVMIVAHSMGGLVSRAALCVRGHEEGRARGAARHAECGLVSRRCRRCAACTRWFARLRGSPRRISPQSRWPAEVFSTFPSLYHLLPPPGFDAELDFFDRGCVARIPGRSRMRPLLASARTCSEALAARAMSASSTSSARGRRRSLARRGGTMSSFTRSRGRAMARCRVACAELPGARTYYTNGCAQRSGAGCGRRAGDCGCAAHRRDDAPADASGRSDGKAEARISDRELRRTHTDKVDWAHMEPDARQDFLRNLNEPAASEAARAAATAGRAEDRGKRAKAPSAGGGQTRRQASRRKRKAAAKRPAQRSQNPATRSHSVSDLARLVSPGPAPARQPRAPCRREARRRRHPRLHLVTRRRRRLAARRRLALVAASVAAGAGRKPPRARLATHPRARPRDTVLPQLAEQTGATAVYWNRRYEPAARDVQRRRRANAAASTASKSSTFNSALLAEPHERAQPQRQALPRVHALHAPHAARPTPAQPLPAPTKLNAPEALARERAARHPPT